MGQSNSQIPNCSTDHCTINHCAVQSWEAIPADTATFTPDITPLILAAHTDNYEIIKVRTMRKCAIHIEFLSKLENN